MSSIPFERPIVLDLRDSGLRYLEPLAWVVGVLHVLWASVAVELKVALLAWAVVWLTIRIGRSLRDAPRTARWHPATGWQLRYDRLGWRTAVLERAHPIAMDLQLLCWRGAEGHRTCRLIGPSAASAAARRRLRVLLRFGRLESDG